MNNTNLIKPRPKGYFLVRDCNGKPRIDGDPRKLPQPIIDMMSDSEFALAVEEYENQETL